jgi:hypothetical protein
MLAVESFNNSVTFRGRKLELCNSCCERLRLAYHNMVDRTRMTKISHPEEKENKEEEEEC